MAEADEFASLHEATLATLRETAASAKPLLRGYSHAVAAVGAVLGVVALLRVTAGDPPKQLSLFVYGASMVLLFTFSALYHVGNWSPRRHVLLRRLDHANIFVLIAGTYTPVLYNVLSGWWRIGLLTAVWTVAAGGMVAVAVAPNMRRQMRVALYVAMGWAALVGGPLLIRTLGASALLLPAIGGALYTLGALGYAFNRPRLWPRVFGYHELFHLAVIVASAVFFVFILHDIVPFTPR